MFKLKAYAVAQDPQTTRTGKTKLDGWGLPLQTIYLYKTAGQRFSTAEKKVIGDYQKDFFNQLEKILEQHPGYIKSHGWDQLPKIYNDPRSYDLAEHIADVRKHHDAAHDPALSMILRQQYFVDRLAKELDDKNIIENYGIDLEIVNSTSPVLKRFVDRKVFTRPKPGSIYTTLFE